MVPPQFAGGDETRRYGCSSLGYRALAGAAAMAGGHADHLQPRHFRGRGRVVLTTPMTTEELAFVPILRVLWRARIFIAAVTLVSAIAFGLYALLAPKIYKSEAVLSAV